MHTDLHAGAISQVLEIGISWKVAENPNNLDYSQRKGPAEDVTKQKTILWSVLWV